MYELTAPGEERACGQAGSTLCRDNGRGRPANDERQKAAYSRGATKPRTYNWKENYVSTQPSETA